MAVHQTPNSHGRLFEGRLRPILAIHAVPSATISVHEQPAGIGKAGLARECLLVGVSGMAGIGGKWPGPFRKDRRVRGAT